MTVGKHGRLTYRKGTMDLSNLLDDQLVPQGANGNKRMLVTGMLGTKFLRNRLILPSIRKRTSAGRVAGPCAITSRKHPAARTGLSAC